MVSIEDLYRNCSILADAKEKAGQCVDAYKVILDGTRSGSGQKRLAAQFISRFFRHFPELSDDSLEAIFDLCEDEDFGVMKQAVRDLPVLCKDSVEYGKRATYVLLQLLAGVQPSEQSVITESLLAVLKSNTRETLKHMLELMTHDEEDLCHQAIVFLHSKLKLILSCDDSQEIEEILVVHCKKLIDEVSDEECLLLIRTLKLLPSMTALAGRLHLLDVISRRLDMAGPPQDMDEVEQAMLFLKETEGLLSKNVPSTNFVNYVCLHVLPVCGARGYGDETNSTCILKLLAEIVGLCEDTDCSDNSLTNVHDALNQIIPIPILSDNEDTFCLQEAEASVEKLAQVECILYTFHTLCRLRPDYLTSSVNLETTRDLRVWLQYVSRVVQAKSKNLHSKTQATDSLQIKSRETMMNNINSMIKDFFRNPPSFKSTICLSFKAAASDESKKSSSAGEKRKLISPISVNSEVNPPKVQKLLDMEQEKPKQFNPKSSSIQTQSTGRQNQRFHPQSERSANNRHQSFSNRARQGFKQQHQVYRAQGQGPNQGRRSLQLNSTQSISPQNSLSQRPPFQPSRPIFARHQMQKARTSAPRFEYRGRPAEVQSQFNRVPPVKSNIVPPLFANFPQNPANNSSQGVREPAGSVQRKVVLKSREQQGDVNFMGNW